VSATLVSSFVAAADVDEPAVFDPGENPELCLYRQRTTALLRRYMQMALDTGRLPSLLGKELFRSKVSSYRMSTFEDAVIFVHDVDKCLEELDSRSKFLIARIVLEEYTREEVCGMLNCCMKTIRREFSEALDRLSQIFMWKGLLRPRNRPRRKSCQEVKNDDFFVS
jgi:hypothetical protein